jgi:hypothetical protein
MEEIDSFKNKFLKVWNNKCPNQYLPNILPAVKRIVVVGDIHGDYNLMIESLKLAKVLNKQGKWTNNPKYRETVIVQVGDQIDSCRFDGKNKCNNPNTKKNDKADDIKILKYFTNLHEEASKLGGAVYSIIGNHELMNVEGNFAYVSYENLNDSYFSNYNSKGKNFISLEEARKDAFKPGNEVANFIACTRKLALLIGNNLFVHAGIVPEIAKKYDIDKINDIITLYLMNRLNNPEQFFDVISDPKNSPLWNRIFGNKKYDEKKCKELLHPLNKLLPINYLRNTNNIDIAGIDIIVGHTPQIFNGISSKCKNKIWQTDIGGGDAFDMFTDREKTKRKQIQILEILTNISNNKKKFNILKKFIKIYE